MKNLREVFLNEGIDEQVIQEFKEVHTYIRSYMPTYLRFMVTTSDVMSLCLILIVSRSSVDFLSV